ncbi:MAG: YgcG family protein, partial [Sulfuricella sp.]
MRQAWLSGVVVALWLLLAPWAAAETAVPPLQARVTDLTRTLQPSQRAALEQTLQTFEERKGSQIAVLIVPSTQPETIEQYSLRVAESWKLGRKGVDDGVLLLVAKDDRKLRIEVGYGLEGAIPDAVAKRIISEIISPYFKKGDFYGGISAGVERMIKVIEGEPLPEKKTSRSSGKPSFSGDWLGLAFVVAVVVGGMMRALFGQFVGGLVAGSVTAVIAWLLFASAMVALGAGLV